MQNKTTIWIIVIILIIAGGFVVLNKKPAGPKEAIKVGGLFGLTGFVSFAAYPV